MGAPRTEGCYAAGTTLQIEAGSVQRRQDTDLGRQSLLSEGRLTLPNRTISSAGLSAHPDPMMLSSQVY